MDWLRQRRIVRGLAAVLLPLAWPFLIVVQLKVFPQISQSPIASNILTWVITAPLPLWTAITDCDWSFWRPSLFLGEFVLVYLQARSFLDFAFSQMFTTYYERFGIAAVVSMALYNGQRGSDHKQLFYRFSPAHIYLLYGAYYLVYTLTQ